MGLPACSGGGGSGGATGKPMARAGASEAAAALGSREAEGALAAPAPAAGEPGVLEPGTGVAGGTLVAGALAAGTAVVIGAPAGGEADRAFGASGLGAAGGVVC